MHIVACRGAVGVDPEFRDTHAKSVRGARVHNSLGCVKKSVKKSVKNLVNNFGEKLGEKLGGKLKSRR